MDGGPSRFTRFCGEMAKAGWTATGRWLASYTKAGPKHPGRAATNAGCLLLFPFVTLLVWFLQAMLWLVIALPIAAWATLWSLLTFLSALTDGLLTQRRRRRLQPSRVEATEPPPPGAS